MPHVRQHLQATLHASDVVLSEACHTSHVARHTPRHLQLQHFEPERSICAVDSRLQSNHVTRHTSHVTRHTPHVTRHTSHVTRHTSPAQSQHQPLAHARSNSPRTATPSQNPKPVTITRGHAPAAAGPWRRAELTLGLQRASCSEQSPPP